jgi:hypothetical protein
MVDIVALSIAQIIALIAINTIGIVCIGSIFYLMRKKTPEPKAKFMVSAKMGLVSIFIFAVISGDVGISLWIKSGNMQAMQIAIPLFVCLGPFMFPIVAAGTYIQLVCRDKIQEYVDSHKR